MPSLKISVCVGGLAPTSQPLLRGIDAEEGYFYPHNEEMES